MTTMNHANLSLLRSNLNSSLLERHDAIDAMLMAALAGEHVVLLGPPGTGKSLLARNLARALGGSYFETLLTRFSSPEDLIGPVSLSGLQNDTYRRVLDGRIGTCDVAFVDEVFKSNAGTLNAMLAILNERVIHDEGKAKKIPLKICVAASNELPRGEEGLEALWDRFIVRVPVEYVKLAESRVRMMIEVLPEVPADSFPLDALEACSSEAMALPFADDCAGDFMVLLMKLKEKGVVVSDRRLVKLSKLLRASAYLQGSASCSSEHFDLLLDALWDRPEQRPEIAAILAASSAPEVTETQTPEVMTERSAFGGARARGRPRERHG